MVVRRLLSLVVCLLGCGVGGCTAAGGERFQFTRVNMGVSTRIVVQSGNREATAEAVAAAFSRIGEIEDAASDYRERSEVMRLCRGEMGRVGEWVEVSVDLWRLLKAGREVAEASSGAFDVTVGPAVKLWRETRRSGVMPNAVALVDARSRIDWGSVEVDPARPRVRIMREGLRIDFGGIAKGYAAEEAVKVLQDRGHRRCLVALAGDVCAGDAPDHEPGWVVELHGEMSDRAIGRIWLRNAAVSTSGDAEQFVDIGGVRYSHIVDPRTGVGVVGGRVVTTVGDDGALTDAVATAAVGMNRQGLEELAARSGVTLIVHRSSGEPEVIGDGRRVRWIGDSK